MQLRTSKVKGSRDDVTVVIWQGMTNTIGHSDTSAASRLPSMMQRLGGGLTLSRISEVLCTLQMRLTQAMDRW